jgi:hypothetical protein
MMIPQYTSNIHGIQSCLLEEYLFYTGQSRQWAHGETPLDFLDQASYNYAVAIKSKPKDASLHMKLGQVLEERYYTEDLFGLKKEVSV